MKFRIRQSDDLEAAQHLDKVCFPTDAREDFGNQAIWLATLVDDPTTAVGFASMALEPREGDMVPTPHITRMGVIPEYRGFRLQRRLAQVCIRAAESAGNDAIYTYCSSYNTQSLRSLIHAGFLPYSCHDGWMLLGRWTKHRPMDKRHASSWGQ